MSQIEQTIDDMQAYIDDCKSPTFGGGGKVICEKDVLENFLEDLRSETPEEIKKYQHLVAQKDSIIANAEAHAQAIVESAAKQTEKMINDHEIMQKAFEQAQALIERAQADATQIIASAQNDADNVRVSALKYTDELLGKVQIIAQTALREQEIHQASVITSLKDVLAVVAENRGELVPDGVAAGQVQTPAEKEDSIGTGDELFSEVDM